MTVHAPDEVEAIVAHLVRYGEIRHRVALVERLEQKRKLVDSAHKHRMAEQNSINAAEASTLVRRMVNVVIKHVPDREARSHIVRDVQLLIGSDERLREADLNCLVPDGLLQRAPDAVAHSRARPYANAPRSCESVLGRRTRHDAVTR